MVDPAKLNSVLSAVAEGVRGQGERMGQATTDLNEVLTALNARSDKIRDDWRSFRQFSDTYGAAADNIVKILNAASTTSSTVTGKAKALDSLLLNVIGFSEAGTDLLGPNRDNLVLPRLTGRQRTVPRADLAAAQLRGALPVTARCSPLMQRNSR